MPGFGWGSGLALFLAFALLIGSAARVEAGGPSRHHYAPADDALCGVGLAPLMGSVALPHTVAALAGGKPLLVVALGSSSTQGYGASAPENAYPAQLADLLQSRFPGSAITVVNKGVGGDNIENMLDRLPVDVLALKPQLVIWQTGTNDAIKSLPPERFRAALLNGLRALQVKSIDTILMTPQYAPKFTAASDYDIYLDVMREAAAQQKVPLFRRFGLSRRWATEQRFADIPFVAPDGLHPTDASYRCTAVLLTEGISRLAGKAAIQ